MKKFSRNKKEFVKEFLLRLFQIWCWFDMIWSNENDRRRWWWIQTKSSLKFFIIHIIEYSHSLFELVKFSEDIDLNEILIDFHHFSSHLQMKLIIDWDKSRFEKSYWIKYWSQLFIVRVLTSSENEILIIRWISTSQMKFIIVVFIRLSNDIRSSHQFFILSINIQQIILQISIINIFSFHIIFISIKTFFSYLLWNNFIWIIFSLSYSFVTRISTDHSDLFLFFDSNENIRTDLLWVFFIVDFISFILFTDEDFFSNQWNYW